MNRYFVDNKIEEHKEEIINNLGSKNKKSFRVWRYKIMDLYGCLGIKEMIEHYLDQDLDKCGSDNFDNLTTSCRKCNRQKKIRTLKSF